MGPQSGDCRQKPLVILYERYKDINGGIRNRENAEYQIQ